MPLNFLFNHFDTQKLYTNSKSWFHRNIFLEPGYMSVKLMLCESKNIGITIQRNFHVSEV